MYEPTEIKRGIVSTDYLPKFEHVNAGTVEEATSLLEKYGEEAVVIAGGTDLLRMLKGRIHPIQPQIVVNIKSISNPGLNYIEKDSTGLRIGSMTTLHSIETNEFIRNNYSIYPSYYHFSGGSVHRYRNGSCSRCNVHFVYSTIFSSYYGIGYIFPSI